MNWQDYRLSLSRMKYIAETSNHFQATYNFPTEGQPKQICCCRRPRLLKLPIETLMTYANIGVREPIFTKHRSTQTFLLNQKSSARTDGFSSFKCDSARKYSIIVHYYTLTDGGLQSIPRESNDQNDEDMAAMLDELTIEDSEESFVIVPHPHIKTSCTCEKHVNT